MAEAEPARFLRVSGEGTTAAIHTEIRVRIAERLMP